MFETAVLEISWLIVIPVVLLAIYGLFALGVKIRDMLHLYLLLRKGAPGSMEHYQELIKKYQSKADREAQEILEQKIRRVWRSTSPVQWLDTRLLQRECIKLIEDIAAVYYPSSPRPMLEVTILELLRMNGRITHEVKSLLDPLPVLHKVSISTIIETKDIYQQTKNILSKKSIRASGSIAGGTWRIINALNPQYWLNRFLFEGATEMVGRKILTSVFRIVGSEAIRIYSHSSAVRVDPAALLTAENPEQVEQIREAIQQAQVTLAQSDQSNYSEEENRVEEKQPQPAVYIEEEHEQISSYIEIITEYEFPDEGFNPKLEEGEQMLLKDQGTQPSDDGVTFKQKMYGKVAETLSSFIEGSMNVWDRMVNRESVLRNYNKRGIQVGCLEEIRDLPINTIDEICDSYIRKGAWLTAAEGAATGMGGAFMLSADAISLLALQLRTIQQIGYCYGFDVSLPHEKLFAAKLLAEAYMHPAKKERATVLNEMRYAARMIRGSAPLGILRKRLFVYGFAKVAEKIGLKLGGRKTAQLVPVLGAVAGGLINRKVTQDIAEVAREVYRDRLKQYQEEHQGSQEVHYP
ncbi:MAG: EcsC family protein [bacterium]